MRYILIICFLSISLLAEDLVEFDYELDAYYSNVSAFIDLDTATEITDAGGHTESKIYKDLVLNSLSPNIFLVELAAHPMPIAGMYYRHEHAGMYRKTQLEKFNYVKAITAGFEEPYSISFFMGRMMVFPQGINPLGDKKKNGGHIGKNRAYIGYLLTLGKHTIKDNYAHSDNWMNVEFKLKGTREQEIKDLDWSFRVGGRFHDNHNFVDTLYLGARRKSIDYQRTVYSFIYNSAFNTMIAVDSKEFKLTEAEFVVEKTFPLSWSKKMSFGIGLGYLYYSNNKYSGDLKEDGVDNHQLIIRPNFKW